MTSRLDAIRQRAKAATEGPWVEGFTSFNTGQEPAVLTVGRVHALTNVVARTTKDRDRAFISHARTDVPLLLAVCEAARGVVEHMDLVAGAQPDHDWCVSKRREGEWPVCVAALDAALRPLLEPEP